MLSGSSEVTRKSSRWRQHLPQASCSTEVFDRPPICPVMAARSGRQDWQARFPVGDLCTAYRTNLPTLTLGSDDTEASDFVPASSACLKCLPLSASSQIRPATSILVASQNYPSRISSFLHSSFSPIHRRASQCPPQCSSSTPDFHSLRAADRM